MLNREESRNRMPPEQPYRNAGRGSYQPGQTLAGRFHLVRFLEEGGLGNVWQAEDMRLDGEPVACKILKEDFVNDARAISDLKREVLLARRLRHPNILAVYTFWETPAERFVTMEYIDGEDVGHALQRRGRPYTVHEIMPWLGDLAHALDYAHHCGILHRDVKPGNILLDEKGMVRLADFGIARCFLETHSRHAGAETCGTVMYMSPEQLQGLPAGPASDQYSLAASVYELLAGAPPFQSEDIVSEIQLRPPNVLERAGARVNQAIQKALSKSPEDRYANCVEFVRALESAATSKPGVSPVDVALEQRRADETVVLPRPDTAILRMRLGAILRAEGLLTELQLQEALTIQKESKRKLGEILVWLGFVDETSIAQAVSQQLRAAFSTLEGEEIDPEVLGMLTPNIAREKGCLPLRHVGDFLVVAMVDPLDITTLNEIEARYGRQAQLLVTTKTCLAARLDKLAAKES